MNLNFAFQTAVPRQSNPKNPNKMKRQREDMQVNVAGLRRNIKNLAHNYSDAQVKVREATSNDPWGPSSTIMSEIADLTYNVVAFTEIMQMIWKRLNDHGKNWRHVYKALVLLEYLIKTGSEKVATQCKENIFAIQTLRDFQYVDENKDHGVNVREKAKLLAQLLRDDDRLKNERTRALKAKERFAQTASGFGSDTGLDSMSPSSPSFPGQFRDSWRTPSCDSDSTPTRGGVAAGELECARPQTVGEEELQLQLALAMSREEAEQEEQKRRSDDVRLQLALSQSENEFKQKKDSPSHMLDLLDVSIGAPTPPPSSTVDPWGMPAAPPPPAHPPRPQTDPWSLSTGTGGSTVSSAADPWAPVSSPPQNIQKSPIIAGAGNTDPWRAVSPVAKPLVAGADPWSPATDISPSHSLTSPIPTPASDLDEFDFISKRNLLTVNNANSLNNNSTDSTSPDPFDLTGLGDTLSTTNAAPKKTPHSFLGENSGLVNLDNLVTKPITPPNQPIHPVPAAALANPFSTLVPGASTTQPIFPPGYSPANSTGQLQQPLMPQPNPFLS